MTDHYLDVVEHRDIPVLRLTDAQSVSRLHVNELHNVLLSFVQAKRPPRLVISFRNVKMLPSSAISAVLRCRQELLSEGGRLRLCEMIEPVREAFRVPNLDGTVLTICDNEAAAVASLLSD